MIATIVDAQAATSVSSVGIELPSWTVALLFVLVFTVIMFAGYRERERTADHELQRLGQKLKLSDPGSDWTRLVARQSRRSSGRVIGLYVAFLGSLPLIYWSAYAKDRSGPWPWWPMLLPVSAALGTVAGHLLPVALAAPAARVAAVRRRQLTDYVMPWEVVMAAVSTVLPLAAVIIAAIDVTEGTNAPMAAVIVALAGALSLALIAVLCWVIRRVLRQPVTATTDAGLEWGEVLRSQLLRDQLVAVTFVSAGGGGSVLLWGLTRGMRGLPDWGNDAAVIVAAACVIAIMGVLVAGLADRRFAWVRTHIVTGQRGFTGQHG